MAILKIKDENGEWIGVPAIVGPAGPAGLQGPIGETGPEGPQGIPGPKGNDGYTPVKGVDYFDGADGPAGENGYTPVKGVDYFTEEDKEEFKNNIVINIDTTAVTDEQKNIIRNTIQTGACNYCLFINNNPVVGYQIYLGGSWAADQIYYFVFNSTDNDNDGYAWYAKFGVYIWNDSKQQFSHNTPNFSQSGISGDSIHIPSTSRFGTTANRTLTSNLRYIKDNYYDKTAVNDLISGLTAGINLQIVETLPTENIDTNTIYLILKEESFLNDYYDEYMYINSQWELIGNTRVDLTGLAAADISYDDSALDITIPTVQAAINHLLENMLDTAGVENLLADKGFVTEERVNELITAAFGSITNAEEVSY